ncbi:hypothetical protein SE92_05680 [Bradyrhizobium sp. AT1]|nr:hypothetical protein SE92_05680 [Bradyrhizobium sp. AT1]
MRESSAEGLCGFATGLAPQIGVIARLDRAIQQSRDFGVKSIGRGVLDHPPSRVMTAEYGAAVSHQFTALANI